MVPKFYFAAILANIYFITLILAKYWFNLHIFNFNKQNMLISRFNCFLYNFLIYLPIKALLIYYINFLILSLVYGIGKIK